MIPHVSIVILNWNGRKYLEQFLPSVAASTYTNFSIVVADNGSTDDSVSFLNAAYPQVRLILLKENYGFAKGYNEALKQVNADYYVLLNSDVEVSPAWIEPVVALMENDKNIGACQPKLLQYGNRTSFEYSGACGGWLDRFGYPFARGRIFDHCEMDKGQYDEVAPIFWASGAGMFVRAPLYHALGGLDEYFFAHQEEIDFCWRLQLMGYAVYSCPASVLYHVGGGTLPKGNSRKVYLNFRNNLVMMSKNMPFSESWWKIPYRFVLDAISAFKSLFAGEGRYFVAVFNAHVSFIGWLMKNSSSNSGIGQKRVVLKGYYHGSIVWKHFIKRKTRFSEIIGSKI
ncbi:MAG: glycosyltransferase family 2 protein [Flavitalea sp.]